MLNLIFAKSSFIIYIRLYIMRKHTNLAQVNFNPLASS